MNVIAIIGVLLLIGLVKKKCDPDGGLRDYGGTRGGEKFARCDL